RDERRRRAVHAKTEEGRMSERHHARVTDQQVGGHGKKAPDQDFREKAAPELGQHQRRNDQRRRYDPKGDPEALVGAFAHLGVGTKRPVGRKSRVRISTTKETMTACAGLTTMAA